MTLPDLSLLDASLQASSIDAPQSRTKQSKTTNSDFAWNDLSEDIKNSIRSMVLLESNSSSRISHQNARCDSDFCESCPEWLCDEQFWKKLCHEYKWDRNDRITGFHKIDETDPRKWKKQFIKWCGLRFTDRYELQEAIDALMDHSNRTGAWPDDTSTIREYTFFKFGPIHTWDVSKVTSMDALFANQPLFNQDIGEWDVSSVINMNGMFQGAESFNQDISKWNVSRVVGMGAMFMNATQFNNGGSANSIEKPLTWDVSKVRTMNEMFSNAVSFNQNIGSWSVSRVRSMDFMFHGASSFNNGDQLGVSTKPLLWDVSNVESMTCLFMEASSFNQDISNWDVSEVEKMSYVFDEARSFNNGDPPGQSNKPLQWTVSNVKTMECMFQYATSFNQNLNSWDVSGVRNMADMFRDASSFNNGDPRGVSENPLTFDVSNVEDTSDMFNSAIAFNQNISNWNLSQCNNFSFMFLKAEDFNNGDPPGQSNKPIRWLLAANVAKNLSGMFCKAEKFNQDISNWRLAEVKYMNNIFDGARSFNNGDPPGQSNKPLRWTLSNVELMSEMFKDAISFNQDIGEWNVSSVGDMEAMFQGAKLFNQTISTWNVSQVRRMTRMFEGASSFNQNLSEWNVSNVKDMSYMFRLAEAFNNGDPAGVSTKPLAFDMTNVEMMIGLFQHATTFNQTLGKEDPRFKAILFKALNMSLMFYGARSFNNGDPPGQFTKPFRLQVPNVNDMRAMFMNAINFNQLFVLKGAANLFCMASMFARAFSFNNGDPEGVSTKPLIANFGTDAPRVKDMTSMFRSATSFNQKIDALMPYGLGSSYLKFTSRMFQDAYLFNNGKPPGFCDPGRKLQWNILHVTRMDKMFRSATSFNQNLSHWTVHNVEDMTEMFYNANKFNNGEPPGNSTQPLLWAVRNVRSMKHMFQYASLFNQNIGEWNVSKVTSMAGMFQGAMTFNNGQPPENSTQPLLWDVWNVQDMSAMFKDAHCFNQNISSWTVGNVEDMTSMFEGADRFNNGEPPGDPTQSLKWNVFNVQSMAKMFAFAESFNQNISSWKVENVQDMTEMFYNALTFNANLNLWSVSKNVKMDDMFHGASSFNENFQPNMS